LVGKTRPVPLRILGPKPPKPFGPSALGFKATVITVLLAAFVIVILAVVVKNVVYTALPAAQQTVRAADQPAVWELARALLVIAATWAQRHQTLC
jgi:hypothetical protein